MPHVIRVRDVVRASVHEFGTEERMMRGPYELFHPVGPVHLEGMLIDWLEGDASHRARVVSAALGDAHPGERVLLRLPPLTFENQWWLCEIEAVDGVAAD